MMSYTKINPPVIDFTIKNQILLLSGEAIIITSGKMDGDYLIGYCIVDLHEYHYMKHFKNKKKLT